MNFPLQRWKYHWILKLTSIRDGHQYKIPFSCNCWLQYTFFSFWLTRAGIPISLFLNTTRKPTIFDKCYTPAWPSKVVLLKFACKYEEASKQPITKYYCNHVIISHRSAREFDSSVTRGLIIFNSTEPDRNFFQLWVFCFCFHAFVFLAYVDTYLWEILQRHRRGC